MLLCNKTGGMESVVDLTKACTSLTTALRTMEIFELFYGDGHPLVVYNNLSNTYEEQKAPNRQLPPKIFHIGLSAEIYRI